LGWAFKKFLQQWYRKQLAVSAYNTVTSV